MNTWQAIEHLHYNSFMNVTKHGYFLLVNIYNSSYHLFFSPMLRQHTMAGSQFEFTSLTSVYNVITFLLEQHNYSF